MKKAKKTRKLLSPRLPTKRGYNICITITKRCQTKCRKKWRGGLKETIQLMLIRPPQ